MKLRITDNIKHIQEPLKAKPPEELAKKAKIAEAAEGFESIFTSMMLKSMTKTTEGGMFGDSGFGGDYFDTMFQMNMAGKISNSSNLGIAESLYRKITGENLDDLRTALRKNESVSKSAPESIKIDPESIKAKGLQPSSKTFERVERFDKIIDAASKDFGVDKNLIKSVIYTESAGIEKAESHKYAKGLMQLIDSTADEMGVKNVWDPKDNIYGGTKYLSGLLKKYDGDVKLSLAAYNAGPGNVAKYDGVPPFDETQKYINRVLGYYNHLAG